MFSFDLRLKLYLVHDVDVLVAVLVAAAVPAQRRVGEGLVVCEAGQPPEAAGAGRAAHAAGEEAVRGDQLVRVPHRAGVHHRHRPANSIVYSRVCLIRIFRSEQRTLDNLLTSTSHHETERVTILLQIDISRLNLVKNINFGLDQIKNFLTHRKIVFWVTEHFCIKRTF